MLGLSNTQFHCNLTWLFLFSPIARFQESNQFDVELKKCSIRDVKPGTFPGCENPHGK